LLVADGAQKVVIARAEAAARRARAARERAARYRQRGEQWLAEVEELLATAQELVAANAEFRARLSRRRRPRRTIRERLGAALAAQQTALAYADTDRERGEIARARFQEDAAAGFAVLAEMLEDIIVGEQDQARHLDGGLPRDTAIAV
jgi:hypothetical protein